MSGTATCAAHRHTVWAGRAVGHPGQDPRRCRYVPTFTPRYVSPILQIFINEYFIYYYDQKSTDIAPRTWLSWRTMSRLPRSWCRRKWISWVDNHDLSPFDLHHFWLIFWSFTVLPQRRKLRWLVSGARSDDRFILLCMFIQLSFPFKTIEHFCGLKSLVILLNRMREMT